MSPYRPLFASGHLQTLLAWARPRGLPALPAPVSRVFEVAPDARVLAHCHWHERPDAHPTLLLLHGLEGSSDAHYMRGIALKAWVAGWNVVRLNQRNCGNTEHLSRGLYHSGLTRDPLHVLTELVDHDGARAVTIAGYSLGGNLALKLAGELEEGAPPELVAVCAVSPTIDLAECVTALERRQNLAYELNFVRNLKSRMRRKAAVFPDEFDLAPLRRVWTVRQFDEAYTAPHHGFRDASDYYQRASALRVIERIRVPTLILTSEDDPFVPPTPFRDRRVTGNPHITVLITQHGGHCAYLERPDATYDGYWAEREIVRFASAQVRPSLLPAYRSASAQTRVPSLLPRV